MSQTVIRGTQILNNTVQRQDLDTSTVGQAVVTKLVQGSGITLSSTGADAGTGDVTVTSPDVVSTDAGNIATLGTDNHILVPQSQIWSVRLRSFNAVGNSNFSVDQRNAGNDSVSPATGTFLLDRWMFLKTGTMTVTSSRIGGGGILIPGTSFAIADCSRSLKLTTQQASLAAGDYCGVLQTLEGSNWRELSGDVTSLSLLVLSDVANLKFSVSIRPPDGTQSLVKLCTVPSAGTWTLITLPNLPKPTSGNFSILPGVSGYTLGIFLACGSTWTAPAADTWQAGNFFGAPGMDNWCSKPVNTNFYCAFIQHQPGALCETLIDCPFPQNLFDCCRYFQKSYDYATKPGTVVANGQIQTIAAAGGYPNTAQVLFNPRMAKVPTCTAYAPNNGATPQVYDATLPGNRVVNTGGWGAGETGFSGFGLNSTNGGIAQYNFHYTADTGM